MYTFFRFVSLFCFAIAGFGVVLALLAVVTPHPLSMTLFTISMLPIWGGAILGCFAGEAALRYVR